MISEAGRYRKTLHMLLMHVIQVRTLPADKLNIIKEEKKDASWTFDVMVKVTFNDALGLGFDSRPGQIGRNVVSDSPLLRNFFGDLLPRR